MRAVTDADDDDDDADNAGHHSTTTMVTYRQSINQPIVRPIGTVV